PDAAFDLLRTGQVTVQAGIRPGLLTYSTQLPGLRGLEDRYGAIVIGMAVRKVRLSGSAMSARSLPSPKPPAPCSRLGTVPACAEYRWYPYKGSKSNHS